MKIVHVSTFAIALVVFGMSGQPKVVSAQSAPGGLLERYTGMLNQLRTELTAEIPKPGNEKQVTELLTSNKLDAKRVKFVVLLEGTPAGLAEFAQQGKEQERLIEQLLADPELMKQMLVADGAAEGKYGPAMKIYTDIWKASEKAKDGVLQRLALAIAMEHAIPVRETINPVERYLDFEKAYLDGELDPAFANFDVWELRFVVDGNEPDWARAWGREMLRTYRPDHIHTKSDGGRYSGIVRSNVLYGEIGSGKTGLNFRTTRTSS